MKWFVAFATQGVFRFGPDIEPYNDGKGSCCCLLWAGSGVQHVDLRESLWWKLKGQKSALHLWLYSVTKCNSTQLLSVVISWRLSSMQPWSLIALPDYVCSSFHEAFSFSLLPPSPSHVPKMCQLQNKGNITESVWWESYRDQQLPAVITVAVLSVMLYFTFA